MARYAEDPTSLSGDGSGADSFLRYVRPICNIHAFGKLSGTDLYYLRIVGRFCSIRCSDIYAA